MDSFVEYSTSGLENPLTHLLLAIFVHLYVVRSSVRLRWLALTVGLLAMSRVDTVLAVLPVLAHASVFAWKQVRSRLALRELLIGFSPLLV